MGEQRDTDYREEVKAIGRFSKKVKNIASIVSAIVTIGGIGAWVGVLNYTVNEIRKDLDGVETVIKELPSKFTKIDETERSRLTSLRDASLAQFDSDKDELWEVKTAISQIRLEMRFRHGERPTPSMPTAAPRPRRRPTKVEVERVAKTSDAALEEMVEPPSGDDPLESLTF